LIHFYKRDRFTNLLTQNRERRVARKFMI